LLLQDIKQIEVCNCQSRRIRWMRHPFAFHTGHFLWHNFGDLASRIVEVWP
jgi:hypothetical protein